MLSTIHVVPVECLVCAEKYAHLLCRQLNSLCFNFVVPELVGLGLRNKSEFYGLGFCNQLESTRF